MQEKMVIYVKTANATNRYFQAEHGNEITILPNPLNIK